MGFGVWRLGFSAWGLGFRGGGGVGVGGGGGGASPILSRNPKKAQSAFELKCFFAFSSPLSLSLSLSLCLSVSPFSSWLFLFRSLSLSLSLPLTLSPSPSLGACKKLPAGRYRIAAGSALLGLGALAATRLQPPHEPSLGLWGHC